MEKVKNNMILAVIALMMVGLGFVYFNTMASIGLVLIWSVFMLLEFKKAIRKDNSRKDD